MTTADDDRKMRMKTMRFCMRTVKDVDPTHNQSVTSIWNHARDLYFYMTGEQWPYGSTKKLFG